MYLLPSGFLFSQPLPSTDGILYSEHVARIRDVQQKLASVSADDFIAYLAIPGDHSVDYETQQGGYEYVWYACSVMMAVLRVWCEYTSTGKDVPLEAQRNMRNLANDFREKITLCWLCRPRRKNNLYVWACLATVLTSLVLRDSEARDYAFDCAGKVKFDTTQDYTVFLPEELMRGRRALHYHNFAVLPLTIISLVAQLSQHPLACAEDLSILQKELVSDIFGHTKYVESLALCRQDKPEDTDYGWCALAGLLDFVPETCHNSVSPFVGAPALWLTHKNSRLIWESIA